jgi:hypothetical protein
MELIMGWKGTLRSIEASMKRAARENEREAKRRQRELEKRRKEISKLREIERVEYEVEVYENYIDRILTLHCKFSERFLGKSDRKKNKLIREVSAARKSDLKAFEEAKEKYIKNYKRTVALKRLGEKVLNGDVNAYAKAVQYFNPFSEIAEIGSGMKLQVYNTRIVGFVLYVHNDEVVPIESKSLTKAGKLSIKKIAKGKFNELYQDYVCSCILRIARELFAIVPIEIVIITAMDKMVNKKTGHLEDQPILSIAIPKDTLNYLNMEKIDPSDSMNNFVHNMNFNKSRGFNGVETIEPDDISIK